MYSLDLPLTYVGQSVCKEYREISLVHQETREARLQTERLPVKPGDLASLFYREAKLTKILRRRVSV